MRRAFPFCMPTILLALVFQILASLLMWHSYIPVAGQVHAASSITQTTGPGDLGTIVSPNGTVYGITEGKPVGNNLFHSFAQFSVGTGDVAQFQTTTLLPNTSIHNILGRVTGQNPSSIFGTIDSASYYPGANLFLMNPNGIIFGPTANLNVGGMATFTTANYLRLTDTGIIHANPAATSVLTSAPVAAFGFLGSNPAAISMRGSTLEMQPGQSISLVGGNQGFTYTNPNTGASASVPGGVTVTGGHLLATGGQVNIASVGSPGEILAGTLDQAPNINGQTFGNLGTIQVSEQSLIDVSGNGGGTVLIRGGQFVLDNNSTISANITGPGPVTNGVESIGGGVDIVVSQDAVIQKGALIDTSVTGSATPGTTYGGVHIDADHIKVSGVVDLNAGIFVPTTIQSNVAPGSTGGNAGNITLRANQNLDARDFAVLQSNSESAPGDAGSIELSSAQGNISLTNFTVITSQTNKSPGTVGTITLSAPTGNILLADSQLGSLTGMPTIRARGSGGILINANNLELLGGDIGIVNLSNQPPGNLTVNLSGSLTLRGGSTPFTPISAIHALAQGPSPSAGLTITAHDILITDGSSLTTSTVSSGAAGPLNISAVNLQLTNGGQISSGSRQGIDPGTGLPSGPVPSGPGGTVMIQGRTGPADSILIDGRGSGIFTNTEGIGPGGATNLSARSLTIQNGGTISASTKGLAPSAIGGSITVKTTDHVTMTSGALITASSTGPGNAGNISINAGQQLDIMGKSSVETEAKQARGGNIDIQAIDRVRLVNSSISTSVLGGAGSGGNIRIDPNVVVLQNSQVTARAVRGTGGNILITTPLFLKDSTSRVDASTPFGLNGTVTIQSPTSNLSESLGTLPSEPNQAHSLLTQRCAALANGQTSSFVVAGREQLPADPGGWLSSPIALASLGESLDAGHAAPSAPAIMTIAAHDAGTVSLRRLTPAGFLMASFADSETTGCHS